MMLPGFLWVFPKTIIAYCQTQQRIGQCDACPFEWYGIRKKFRKPKATQGYSPIDLYLERNISEDDIVTTAGVMNAISFGLMALTQKGDTIAVESPVYFGILQLAKSLGLNVIELPTHPVTGIESDALKKYCPK